jgi:hypothetical protein
MTSKAAKHPPPKTVATRDSPTTLVKNQLMELRSEASDGRIREILGLAINALEQKEQEELHD